MSSSNVDVPVDLQARPVPSTSTTKFDVRPIPTSFACEPKLRFEYSGSHDGVDTNLLILLHGRGDSEKPFAKLATSLRLPQTATLALQGPLVVPLLDAHEREWWNETDMMGMEVPNPDPSKAVNLLCKVIDELHESPYAWSANHIHLFGFAQGGSLACESAIHYSKTRKQDIGSVVSVQGPLLTHSATILHHRDTKILYVSRQGAALPKHKIGQQVSALQRAFKRVEHLPLPERRGCPLAMPTGKEEWEGIMKFWSDNLLSRSAWERSGEVYEITGDAENVSLSGQSAGMRPGDDIGVESSRTNIVKSQASPEVSKKSASKDVTGTQAASVGTQRALSGSGLKRGFLSKGLS